MNLTPSATCQGANISGMIPHKDKEPAKAVDGTGEKGQDTTDNLEVSQVEYERPTDIEVATPEMVTTIPAFINDCPSEVLAIIFKLVVTDNPTHVRRILLVCKQWHHLVTKDPQMWNFIGLRVPQDCWDVREWAASTRQFISKCLERSQSAVLDINLDFDHLLTTRKQIAIKLDNNVQDLPGTPHPEVVDIQRRIQILRESDGEEHGSNLMVCEPDHALDLIKDLVGPNGSFTARWRTLEIVFPMGDTASRVWNLIIHPFPSLASVSFIKLSRLGTAYSDATLSPDYFPRVKQLRLDVDGNSPILSLFPLSLRNLAVRTTFGSEFPRQLSRFTQLRILSINAGIGKVRDPAELRLSLPLLEELKFVGNFQPAVVMEFDVPSLKHLLIEWSWRWTFTNNIPMVRPSHLRWAPSEEPEGKGEFRLAQNAMHDFLLHFTATEMFTVPHHMKAVLFDLVKSLSPEGFLPTAWKTLAFHNGKRIVETVELLEVMKMQLEDAE